MNSAFISAGLPEISVFRARGLERTKRLDAEYFSPGFRETARLVASLAPRSVASVASVSDGNHFSISDDFVEEGVPYYRGGDVVGNFFVEDSAPYFITREAFDRGYMRRSHLRKGDVLLSIVGTIGECSIVGSEQDATCSCKLAILRPHSISPELLAVFLRSKHGRNQIERLTRGAVQRGLILEDLDQLWVPTFAKATADAVLALVREASGQRELAREYERDAEAALLSALGLSGPPAAEPLSYIARFSDARISGRLDAQYFMPAKEETRRSLSALPGKLLGDRFSSVREMFDPASAPSDMMVRNFDLPDALVPALDSRKVPTPAGEIGSMKKVIRPGDVVVSRLRAYLREIAIVEVGDSTPLVASSEFYVLRAVGPKSESVAPETLVAFLRSAAVQTILKWSQDGSQHPRFAERELLAIPMPDAILAASPEISRLVRQGIEATRTARKLLEDASDLVTRSIEKGELAELARRSNTATS